MRTIKFRAKCFDGYWVYGDLHLLCDQPHIHTAESQYPFAGKRKFIDPDTVGQFTGLCDKNGKKIFEGDVVRRRDSAFGYVDTGVVKYDCHLGAFILEYESYGRTYQSTFKKGFSDNDGKCTIEGTYSYELIGNIYDNPELLSIK